MEMRLGIEGNMKVRSGHEVTNSNSMAIALHELRNRLQLGGGWARLVARTVSNPRSVFVVDTETGFINNQDVHEVGVITYDEQEVINDVINHGSTIQEYFDRTEQNVREGMQMRAYYTVQKTYGLVL